MIEVNLTKAALTEYIRVIGMAFTISKHFTIVNDIIDPSPVDNASEVDGAHRLKHPRISLLPGIVYKSVPNVDEILSDIREKNGIKTIKLVNTEKELGIVLDYEEYIIAFASGSTKSKDTFYSLVDSYMDVPPDDKFSLNPDDLQQARLGNVIVLRHPVYGPVRLSKDNFPFMGVVKVDSSPNFSGTYSFGTYDAELQENYIALHVNYKSCEAFHKYVYVPYEE